MKLCTVCRVHPITYMGTPLCNMCGAKYVNSRLASPQVIGSVVNWPDARWNRDQGQYFQSFGPHPFGVLVPHTILDYPGQDPSTVVGAAVADATSISSDLNQTDQQAQQIDAAFTNCPNPTSDASTMTAQWKSFYTGYQSFSQSTKSTLNNTLSKIMGTAAYIYNLQQIDNTLQSYIEQMNAWAATSQRVCGGAATQNIPPSSPGSGVANTLASVASSVKTLAIIAAVVIGGLYGLSLYEEYKHA